MLLRIFGAYPSQRNYFTATFLANTRSFALALFPPDRTFLSLMPNALPLFGFESESLAANFTCFAFTGTSRAAGSAAFFEDLRIVFALGVFSTFDFDSIRVESLEAGEGLDVTDFGGPEGEM